MEDLLFNALPYLFVLVGLVLVIAVVWLLFFEAETHARHLRREGCVVSHDHFLRQSTAAGPGGDTAVVIEVDSEHLEEAFARLDELIRQAEAGDQDAWKVLNFGKHYGHGPQDLKS